MNTITLSPFPRLERQQVAWSPFAFMLNDEPSEPTAIANEWDPNATLTVSIGVKVADLDHDELSAPVRATPVLKLTAACQDTATTFVSEVALDGVTPHRFTGSTVLEIDTRKIEREIIIYAAVVLPVADNSGKTVPWLRNRIIAESKRLKISLASGIRSFPTSAASFKEEGWYPVPWRFDLMSTELSDDFNHAVRLYLNQDDKQVLQLVNGRDSQNMRDQLVASIYRVLLLTAERLRRGLQPDTTPDRVADEFPESIAAAARRSAVEHLGLGSLDEALNMLRENPEELEYLIMAKTFRK